MPVNDIGEAARAKKGAVIFVYTRCMNPLTGALMNGKSLQQSRTPNFSRIPTGWQIWLLSVI